MPAMIAPERLASLSREELLAVVAELQGQMTVLQRQVAVVAARHEVLQAEIEQLKRSGKRQAAPFSKGPRGAQPTRPGRKPGEGPFQ